jgi:hypothetical protein
VLGFLSGFSLTGTLADDQRLWHIRRSREAAAGNSPDRQVGETVRTTSIKGRRSGTPVREDSPMAGRFVYSMVHFVWSTHNRREWIDVSWEDDLYGYIGGIARNKNAKLIQGGGMPDHLHLLVSMPPTGSISEFVNAFKANSSRWIHEDVPRMKTFAWQ